MRKGIECRVSQEARSVRERSHLSSPRLCLHYQLHHIQSKVEAVLKSVNSQLDHSTDLGACQKIGPVLLRVADAWIVLSLVNCCPDVLGCIGRRVVLGRQIKPNQNLQNFHNWVFTFSSQDTHRWLMVTTHYSWANAVSVVSGSVRLIQGEREGAGPAHAQFSPPPRPPPTNTTLIHSWINFGNCSILGKLTSYKTVVFLHIPKKGIWSLLIGFTQ